MTTHPPRDALDDKVNDAFAGKVVRKDLVRKVKVGANVPVFVLEFLLGKYCASSDRVAIQMGLQVVNDTLADNYIRPDESMKAQSMVKDKGSHTFIDKVKVRVADSERLGRGGQLRRQATCTSRAVRPRLRATADGRRLGPARRASTSTTTSRRASTRSGSTSSTPIQIATFNLEDYRAARREFTTDEWLDLMLRSMGYEPTEMDRRLKLLFLTRLDPARRAQLQPGRARPTRHRQELRRSRSSRPMPSC